MQISRNISIMRHQHHQLYVLTNVCHPPGIVHLCSSASFPWSVSAAIRSGSEDSQSLDTKLKLMADIKLEMEALMVQIKTKTHNTKLYYTLC